MNNLNLDNWQRIQSLFLEGLELATDAVSPWLKKLADEEDESVIQEVRRLLHASTNADLRLETAIEHIAADLTQSGCLGRGLDGESEPAPGKLLGVYRLVKILGRGGMSTVYLASRSDQQFEQTVAIKVLSHGLPGPEQERRLLAERQILARLSHPNIARLLDGGTTSEGLPFFVMEIIDGLPIDSYCDEHRLNLTDRIRLFQKVCKAVHFAHRNLVVHRDIKPSNVLVTEEGEPKLLDFGIAKLLNPTVELDETMTVWRMGTPGYSSPEQILGKPITTASDVYNLGLLLYRLLTGERPYTFRDSAPLRDMEAAILYQKPITPSTVALNITEEVATARQERPDSLRRRLSGDLDNIMLMALRKEPERRYGSVEHLAEDLDRYLAGLPVTARPDTFLYRTNKFIRRHQLGVVGTLSTIFMCVFLIVALIRQEAHTALQRDKAEQVSQMLVSLFEMAGPDPKRGNMLTASELLDLGHVELGRLKGQDETQAMLQYTLGSLYEELGLFGKARELYRLAFEQRLKHLGEANPLVADNLYDLGRATARSGNLEDAVPHFRRALKLRRRYLGDDHPDVAVSLNGLALVLHEGGNYEVAATQYRQALEKSERLNGKNSPQTVKTRGNLALLLFDQGEYHKAELMFRQALDGYRFLDGPANLIAEVLDGLAQTLLAQGDLAAAESITLEALSMRRKHLGKDHPEVARSLAHLASVMLHHNLKEAESLAIKALEQRRQWYGDENAETAESLAILAAIRARQGNDEIAESLYRQSIRIYAKNLSPDHQLANRPVAELGIHLAKSNDCKRALPLLQRAESNLSPKDRRMLAVVELLHQCEFHKS